MVYEDDDVMAFLDINPLAPGHVLLITKAHCETLLDVPRNTFSALFSAAQKIAAAQIKVVGAEGVNWLQNSGTAAGQEILHFHIHLIPRMVDDDLVGIGNLRHIKFQRSVIDCQPIKRESKMNELTVEDLLETIVQEDARYTIDAYHFVREGLDYTVKKLQKPRSREWRRIVRWNPRVCT